MVSVKTKNCLKEESSQCDNFKAVCSVSMELFRISETGKFYFIFKIIQN